MLAFYNYLCTRPAPSVFIRFRTSSAEIKFRSPGMVCLMAAAASPNSSAFSSPISARIPWSTPASKGVSATDTIYNVQVIGSSMVKSGISTDCSRPSVVGSTDAISQGRDQVGKSIVFHDIGHMGFIHTDAVITIDKIHTVFCIAKAFCRISGISETNINIWHHVGEHLLFFFNMIVHSFAR